MVSGLSLMNVTGNYSLNKRKITPDGIKSLFLGDNTDQHTLNELIEYHNLSQFPILSKATRKNYVITKNYIISFLKQKRNATDIYLSKIDFKFISDFDYYLRTIKPLDHQKPLRNNGMMKTYAAFQKNNKSWNPSGMVNKKIHLMPT